MEKTLKTQVTWSFMYFPIFHPSRCFKPRFRAETGTNIWCRDFHEIRASYFYSIPWTPRGFGLVPKRNLWFPGCWENLYLKVNLFFSSRDAHLHVCFEKKKNSFIFYDSWNLTERQLNEGNCYTVFQNHSDFGVIEPSELFFINVLCILTTFDVSCLKSYSTCLLVNLGRNQVQFQ